MTTSEPQQQPVFNYRTLRLLVAIVVFGLPIAVIIFSSTQLSSISRSYYTDARDVFVGALFLIGAFLLAYNGHKPWEKRISKLAGFAAILAAIFPTTCIGCDLNIKSAIHYAAAIVLFSAIAYFCLGPFRDRTKDGKGKKPLRAKIYLVCGWVIIGCMMIVGIAKFTLSEETRDTLLITFVAESIALWAFGVAWIVAAKVFPLLTDEADLHKLSWE